MRVQLHPNGFHPTHVLGTSTFHIGKNSFDYIRLHLLPRDAPSNHVCFKLFQYDHFELSGFWKRQILIRTRFWPQRCWAAPPFSRKTAPQSRDLVTDAKKMPSSLALLAPYPLSSP